MKGTSTIIFATSCTAWYLKEFESMRKRSQASASLLSSAHMQTMTIKFDHKVIHFFP